MRVRGLLCALLLALSLPRAALAADGKEEFEKGLRFYQAQEYDAALPYFQKAYKLSKKRPSTVRALAQCERSLKQYDIALEHFREYLASRPSDAKEIEATIELVEELAQNSKKTNETPPVKSEPPAVKSEPPSTPPVSPPPPPPPPPPPAKKSDKKAPPPPPPPRVAPPPPPPPAIAPPPPPPPAVTAQKPPPAEDSLLDGPWIWVGAGAVVVVGAVVLAIALSGGEDDPYVGSSGVVLRGP